MYGDFDLPVIYQDLANYSMPMFQPVPFGTVLSGSIKMPRQLDADKVQLMNKKDAEGKKSFNNVLKTLAVIGALIFTSSLIKNVKKSGGISKYLSGQWKNLTNLFKAKPAKTSFGKKVLTKCADAAEYIGQKWKNLTAGFKAGMLKPEFWKKIFKK